MNYYKVVALKGHIGAGKSTSMLFAIEADSMYGAMRVARRMPAIKHNKATAIQSVEEITKEEFDYIRQTSAYER